MKNITLTIQPTKSETIIKFAANKVLKSGSFEFNNIDEAKNSPLAQQLFHLPFVKKVYITANFIAIERFSIVEWPDVQEEVKEQIEDFINSGGVIITESAKPQKMPIEVYAESTPNPSVLKFVVNTMLVSNDFEFKNIEEANDAPLAKSLFEFPFVKELYISENYISITKTDSVDWSLVTPEVRSFIREYLAAGNLVVNADIQQDNKQNQQEIEHNLDEVSHQIMVILDEYVRPAVAADGGNILFKSYEPNTKIVNVILQGACSGCPSSTITLKNGIENMLKQLLPGKIEQVVAFNY